MYEIGAIYILYVQPDSTPLDLTHPNSLVLLARVEDSTRLIYAYEIILCAITPGVKSDSVSRKV